MSTHRSLLIALITLLLVSTASDAAARNRHRDRNRQQARPTQPAQFQSFRQFAQQTQMACAMHKGKLFIKVDAQKLRSNFNAYCKIGNGKVLEFNGKGHLYTRYNGDKATDFLGRLSKGTFYPPYTQKRVTVVVKLTDQEHRELDSYIKAGQRNSRETIGSFKYGGGRPKRYYPGSSQANCTSWISSAKLDGSKSLGRTCGVWDSVSPTSWIQSLARNGNDRVQAVLLHQFSGDVNNWRQVDAFISEAMRKH